MFGKSPRTRTDRIGAFSAGLLGWFSNVTVMNLDGLANDEILSIPDEEWSYQHYCNRRGITVYIDAADPRDSFRDFTLLRTMPVRWKPDGALTILRREAAHLNQMRRVCYFSDAEISTTSDATRPRTRATWRWSGAIAYVNNWSEVNVVTGVAAPPDTP